MLIHPVKTLENLASKILDFPCYFYYFAEMKCIIHLQYLKIKIRNTKN